MKTIDIEELETALPYLRELLAAEGEVSLTANGDEVARLLPIVQANAPVETTAD